MRVLKFGGSSLADAGRIAAVGEVVAGAAGERLAAPVVAAALQQRGLPAVPVEATRLLLTDSTFGEAEVDLEGSRERVRRRLGRLPPCAIPVVTGFLAADEAGRVTTLGRGSSDYTAALLGALLEAERVEIWTDVAGVCTAEPRRVPDARRLSAVSYGLAGELAWLGGRVLHPRTVEPLAPLGIPLEVRSTLRPEEPGTLVFGGAEPPGGELAVSARDDLVLLRVEAAGSPDLAAPVQRAAKSAGLTARIVGQTRPGRCLLVVDAAEATEAALRAFERDLWRAVAPDPPGRVETERGVATVAAVVMGRPRLHLLVAGATGRVGSELLRQLARERARIGEALGAEPVLVAAGNRRGFACDERGLEAGAVRRTLAAGGLTGGHRLGEWLDGVAPERAVLVACTAAPEVAALYGGFLDRGIGVVTANKLAPAGDLAEHLRLLELARGRRVPYRYETTVGAALPVLHALAGLRLSGDRLRRLTAVLSGSLCYLCHRLNAGRPFSAAVREARELGYTEPRPWEDLSGEDVARKLVILLREAGVPAERDAVRVERLLPWSLGPDHPVDAFFEPLPELDPVWERRVARARADGLRLAPLARFGRGRARFAVEPVPAASPFGALEPGGNLLVIETGRYRAAPLVIGGPGAGPAVTAAGVLADVVAAARELLGPAGVG